MADEERDRTEEWMAVDANARDEGGEMATMWGERRIPVNEVGRHRHDHRSTKDNDVNAYSLPRSSARTSSVNARSLRTIAPPKATSVAWTRRRVRWQ